MLVSRYLLFRLNLWVDAVTRLNLLRILCTVHSTRSAEHDRFKQSISFHIISAIRNRVTSMDRCQREYSFCVQQTRNVEKYLAIWAWNPFQLCPCPAAIGASSAAGDYRDIPDAATEGARDSAIRPGDPAASGQCSGRQYAVPGFGWTGDAMSMLWVPMSSIRASFGTPCQFFLLE